MIKDILAENERPQFIWGVTIAGHSPYINKYKHPLVEVSSNNFSNKDLEEITQYAQVVYDFNTELAALIKYIDSIEKTILLYIFGDHLPPIKACLLYTSRCV